MFPISQILFNARGATLTNEWPERPRNILAEGNALG